MVSTALAICDFGKTLSEYSTKFEKDDLSKAVTRIDRLRTHNPAVYDEKATALYLRERAETLKELVNDYFVKSIGANFSLISDELFQLQRHLSIVKDGTTWKAIRDDTEAAKENAKASKEKGITKLTNVHIPLFAYTSLFNGNHTAKLGQYVKTDTNRNRRYGFSRTIRSTATIEATLPGSIGPNLKDAYRDALSHYFGVLSDMFANPVAGDILYAEGNMLKPEGGAIWIPTPESLSVNVDQKIIEPRKNLDPAMVLKVGGNTYLVQTWTVDEEEPFDHYLRKYSTGGLKGKVSPHLKLLK